MMDVRLDLSVLCDKDTMSTLTAADQQRVRARLSSVNPVEGTDNFPINELVEASTLDVAQARALATGLLREVAVIQGPPGTGKTFLGVKLIEVLLRNTRNAHHVLNQGVGPDVGPILVVCFTNHALDSFLEGCLDAGMNSIVRVGSTGATSERLQEFNLRNITPSARGVAPLMNLREARQQSIADLGKELVRACEHSTKSLIWEEESVQQLVSSQLGSELCASLKGGMRARNARRQERGDDEWTKVKKRSKKQHVDLMQDWLAGDPLSDWQLGRIQPVASYRPFASGDLLRGLGLGPDSQGDDMDLDLDDDDDDDDEGELGTQELEATVAAFGAQMTLVGQRQGAGAARAAGLGREMQQWWVAQMIQQQREEWKRQREQQRQLKQQQQGPPPARVHAAMASDRSVEELLQADSVWMMSSAERQRLGQHLMREYLGRNGLLQSIADLDADLADIGAQLQERYDESSRATLQRARIVGMTTTGVASRQKLVAALNPKIVIVEEAAEVLEAHVLACLSRNVQHLILIGDHEQLRPKVNRYELQAVSNRGLDLDVSLFERLVVQQGFPIATLAQQRRMRPDFSKLIRATIYPGLLDHPRVCTYPPVKGVKKPLFFLDHDHKEGGDADEGRSKFNKWEAKYAVALARYLLQQGYMPSDIIILVPYVGQLLAVREELRAMNMTMLLSDRDQQEVEDVTGDEGQDGEAGLLGSTKNASGATAVDKLFSKAQVVTDVGRKIRCSTVDNFQGEEGKIIILSLTRNNKAGEIGFLKMRNRACVLLSRAQHGMYILGNRATMEANAGRAPIWPQVLSMMEADDCIGPALEVCCQNHTDSNFISEPADFERLVGDGGCQRTCGVPLTCGHTCPRRCHVDDMGHALVKCMQRCDRVFRDCLHPCDKLCWEECGKCMRKITQPFELECGHMACNVDCWKRYQPGAITCREPVQVTLPCGHTATVACHRAEAVRGKAELCTEPVKVKMPWCGHEIEVPCGQVSSFLEDPKRCSAPCGQLLSCEHTCSSRCGACAERSPTRDTKGSILRAAPAGIVHAPCTQSCSRQLACGHDCSAACHKGAPCPPCKQPCWIRCHHTRCKKQCGEPCALCTRPCVWSCKHMGACTAPCGAPCDRLPCEQRCSKLLRCGHRCPGLCGEQCPQQACVHPECLAAASDKLKSQPVDMVMMRCLGELSSEDVDEDPLVQLGCGHLLTKSSLDGVVDMGRYYTASPDGSGWSSVAPLPQELQRPPTCPSCRVPIRNVLRVGRILNKAVLDLVDRKHLDACNSQLLQAQQQLSDLADYLVRSEDGAMKTVKEADKTIKRLMHVAGDFSAVAEKHVNAPKQKVYEAALARLQRAEEQAGDSGGDASNSCGVDGDGQPLNSGEASLGAAAGGEHSNEGGECGAHTEPGQGAHAAAGTPATSAAAEARLAAARQAYLTTLVVDPLHLSRARRGLLQAAALIIHVAQEAAPAAVSAISAPSPRPEGRGGRPMKPAALTKKAQSVLYQADYVYGLLSEHAPAWVNEALEARSFNSAFQLIHDGVKLVVQRVKQQDAVARAMGRDRGDVLPELLQLIGQARQAGDMAEREHQRYLFSMEVPYPSQEITALRSTLKELDALEEAVKRDQEAEEMLAVLSAVMGVSRPEQSMDYLRGHLYRCPNGHVYVIGECGGAMQTGRCAECNAPIGGGSHQLLSTNARADDALRRMQEHLQTGRRASEQSTPARVTRVQAERAPTSGCSLM